MSWGSLPWIDLQEELKRWEHAGYVAEFWWRDDDATALSQALERLLLISEDANIGIALAVIPARAEETLFTRLSPISHVDILQHGYRHLNWMPVREKKAEFGALRAQRLVAGEIEHGWKLLNTYAPGRVASLFVPPWNRMAQLHLQSLVDVGIQAVSMFGCSSSKYPLWPLAQLNTHLDLIDWKGGRGFVGEEIILKQLITELRCRRQAREWTDRRAESDRLSVAWAKKHHAGNEPLGLLTHHLVHDELTWRFLTRVLERLHSHPAVRWLRTGRMFPA